MNVAKYASDTYMIGMVLLRIIAFTLLWVTSAAHGSYEKGVNAYQDGDIERAMVVWKKAGDARSHFALGMLFLDGLADTPPDAQEAVTLFKKAAGDGHVEAQNTLGILYENGEGVEQDYQTAHYWYTQAAQQGEAIAINNLAALYAKGLGVERDIPKALQLFMASADSGYPVAEHNRELLVESLPGTQISVDKANIRSGPDTQNRRLMTLEKNHPIKLINEQQGWYQIVVDRDGQPTVGWVSASLTARSATSERPSVATTPAPEVKSQQPPSVASGQWGVQLGVFGNANNVRKLQKRLDQNGFDHFTEQFNATLKTVLVGPYSSQKDTQQAREAIRQQVGIEGIVRQLD